MNRHSAIVVTFKRICKLNPQPLSVGVIANRVNGAGSNALHVHDLTPVLVDLCGGIDSSMGVTPVFTAGRPVKPALLLVKPGPCALFARLQMGCAGPFFGRGP